MVSQSILNAFLPSPFSAAWCASTAHRLDVSKMNVLSAPAYTLVCAAYPPNSTCPRRCMRYAAKIPPKMTISEASSHQMASFPVGIPVELRFVAIGFPCIP